MNRYPLWVYILVVLALVLGLTYTLPNFYGESPAVQVSAVKSNLKADAALLKRAQDELTQAGIRVTATSLDSNGFRIRLSNETDQARAKDLLEKSFNQDASNPSYVVALNLLSASPAWLSSINALPMYLGLDLRGGVHFMMQIDMKAALGKYLDSVAADVRSLMREKDIRHAGIERLADRVVVTFRDETTRSQASTQIRKQHPELRFTDEGIGSELKLVLALTTDTERTVLNGALQQNIVTLHKRINELGVAEPVIQQQGLDRIVVQLPGVQDVARAKDLIGRTATLEVRLVDQARLGADTPPAANTDVVTEYDKGVANRLSVKRPVILTGDHFEDAQASFDQNQRPAVTVKLNAAGGRIMRDVTRQNIDKLMAIILIEKGRSEAISVATIRGEFGSRFEITGQFTPQDTNNLAILIRSGAIAAPMTFVEERVIGPSLGAENIKRGFHSVLWGFAAIALFMVVYYVLFGFISIVALAANLLFLIALLSMLQATLTLPGVAAIALALGMAIDANVLINERIREELRAGASPQAAILAGYDRAFGTILDSNVTTFIVGLMLLLFGSGPVRGFAAVHCLGILTSIFSAVVVSRALVNVIYGGRKKLNSLSIGTVWKPGQTVLPPSSSAKI